VVGVDPAGLTLRELMRMGDARKRLEWDQTSGILAMLYNANRAKGASVAHPVDFNPMRQRKRAKMKVPLKTLKAVFVKEK
jgi:hypothetical protein